MKGQVNKMRNKKGFTILELLVVVAIIAILAVIAVPQFMGAIEKAKVSGQIADCASMGKALIMYNFDMSEFPAEGANALDVLVTAPAPKGQWTGPYIDRIVTESKWGKAITYHVVTSADIIGGSTDADMEQADLTEGMVVLKITDTTADIAAALDANDDNDPKTGVIRANNDGTDVFYVVYVAPRE